MYVIELEKTTKNNVGPSCV